jgi:transaldolase
MGSDRKMRLFQDSAELQDFKDALKSEFNISGYTTNPTLMYKAGIRDFEKEVRKIIDYLSEHQPSKCLSVEVFSDDFIEMSEQGHKIHSWANGYEVYIKIPISNTKGLYTGAVIYQLSNVSKIPVNVTAVFTKKQAMAAAYDLDHTGDAKSIISVFAGRIADSGINPKKHMKDLITRVREENYIPRILWASPRQVYDYVLAEKAECDIITMTPELIKKLPLLGTSLDQYSLDTVNMFYNDGVKAGYKI